MSELSMGSVKTNQPPLFVRTILVVYSDRKLTEKEAKGMKRYAFNTFADVRAGQRIKSPNYNNEMQIVSVLPETFRYYNPNTGDLSNTVNNTNQFEIRSLKIVDTADEITGVIVG
jgi:hypothetical protein